MDFTMQKYHDQLTALRPQVILRDKAYQDVVRCHNRITTKQPEMQTAWSRWLYRMHKPMFFVFLSGLSLYLLHTAVFVLFARGMGMFESLLVIPDDIRGALIVWAGLFVLVPIVLQFLFSNEERLLQRDDLTTLVLALQFLLLFGVGIVFVVILVLDGVVDLEGIFRFIYPQSTDLGASLLQTMKWIFWYGFFQMGLYYLLSYPYMVVLRLYVFLNPLFLVPYLVSKLRKGALQQRLEEAKRRYHNHQEPLLERGLLEEADYTLDTIDALLRYYEQGRIHSPRHGAAIHRYEQEMNAYHTAYLNELRASVNAKLSELADTVRSEQKKLDDDLDRRLRLHVDKQKKLDALDAGLDDLQTTKNRYEEALFEYRRSR